MGAILPQVGASLLAIALYVGASLLAITLYVGASLLAITLYVGASLLAIRTLALTDLSLAGKLLQRAIACRQAPTNIQGFRLQGGS